MRGWAERKKKSEGKKVKREKKNENRTALLRVGRMTVHSLSPDGDQGTDQSSTLPPSPGISESLHRRP